MSARLNDLAQDRTDLQFAATRIATFVFVGIARKEFGPCLIRQKTICLNGGPRTVKGHAFEWQASAWDATPAKDALKPFERAYPGKGDAVQEHLVQAPRTQPKYISTCAAHQQGAKIPSVSCETKSGSKGNTRRKRTVRGGGGARGRDFSVSSGSMVSARLIYLAQDRTDLQFAATRIAKRWRSSVSGDCSAKQPDDPTCSVEFLDRVVEVDGGSVPGMTAVWTM